MAETRAENEKINLQFRRKGFVYSIPTGMALVKKNFFTGNIKVVGKVDESTISSIDKVLFIHDETQVTDQMLGALLRSNSVPQSHQDKARAELQYRAAKLLHDQDPVNNPEPQETEDLKNASMKFKVNIPQIIVRKVKAKTGIRLRWPWQSALVLNLQEQELNTDSISIDTSDKIKLQFDTDYRYKIVDPAKFAEHFNSRTSQYGRNATKSLDKAIGAELDQIVINYVRSKGVDSFKNMSSESLFDACQPQILELGVKYGIEVTKVLIVDVKYPENIVEAEAKLKAAKAEAEAKLAENEASLTLQGQIAALRKSFPGIADQDLMELLIRNTQAGTVTTNVNGMPFGAPYMPVGQQQPVQQQLPAWFDEGLGFLYDDTGAIDAAAWREFIAANPSSPLVRLQNPNVLKISPTCVDLLFEANGLNPVINVNQNHI